MRLDKSWIRWIFKQTETNKYNMYCLGLLEFKNQSIKQIKKEIIAVQESIKEETLKDNISDLEQIEKGLFVALSIITNLKHNNK